MARRDAPRGGLQAARRPLMSQSEKSFTVSDRRHFTPEGRPRDDEARADEMAPPEPAATASDPPAAEDGPAEFSHFLLGLAAEAGRLLAGEGVPEATPRHELLASARQIVAILEMLKDKTEGRRTADEDALLAGLLFQLRMAYVERARAVEP
jgi:hypothetical protein